MSSAGQRPDPAVRGLPPHAAGMRIGLYGGSFNPPHAAHVMVSRRALLRLGLDRVWWLVSPGNPLKDNDGLPPVETRLEQARALITDPRIVPTDAESRLGTRYTMDTLSALQARCPGVRFVWIMGGDSFAAFHLWRDWQAIAGTMPFAVIDRPGTTHTGMRSKAALRFAAGRIDESDAALLPLCAPPAWVLLHGPRSDLSSSRLRGDKTRA
ncbi:nicotinate-nucleotide adenylyltransferase [Terrihabitans sp. B22-R8]|uniref:nicotinate-nucleotide adenylyltransferase n=1 Tax=Terrihabitans sp. B22-R8 TaxID=3425128 RepID=UPI00403C8EBB